MESVGTEVCVSARVTLLEFRFGTPLKVLGGLDQVSLIFSGQMITVVLTCRTTRETA